MKKKKKLKLSQVLSIKPLNLGLNWFCPWKKNLFILENFFLIKKAYDFNHKPDNQNTKFPSKILYSFISLRIFKAQNRALSGLESGFQRFALKNTSTLSYPLKFTSK